MFCCVLPPLCSHRQECSSANSSAGQHYIKLNNTTFNTTYNRTTLHQTGQHYIQRYFKSDNTTSNWTTLHSTLLQFRQNYFKSDNTTSNQTTLLKIGQHYHSSYLSFILHRLDNTMYFKSDNTSSNRTTVVQIRQTYLKFKTSSNWTTLCVLFRFCFAWLYWTTLHARVDSARHQLVLAAL